MRKTGVFTILLASLVVSGCSIQDLMFWKKNAQDPSQQVEPEPEPQPEPNPEPPVNDEVFEEKDVKIYRRPGVVDKQIKLRFYEDTPSIPYISVSEFNKEFFNRELTKMENGFYKLGNDSYIGFTYGSNLLYAQGLSSFDSHPDFKSNTGRLFIKLDSIDFTTPQERVVNLNNYHITVHKDDYVPLSLLSKLMGGSQLYDISYNGKDIYVIDRDGQLGQETPQSAFGAAYYEELESITTVRKRDMADYVYNELCFVFDNLRGYTEHMVFGDNNLVSLGLNGLLEKYAPKTKEYLLSLDKAKYYEGVYSLFNGLYDNGHTGLLADFDAMDAAKARKSEQEFKDLYNRASSQSMVSTYALSGAVLGRIMMFGSGHSNNYYKFDAATKTAYIGFAKFIVDYDGWDAFYKGEVEEEPYETDSYAYVRKQMYQAKADGVKNLVIDISSNTGGSSYALEGIVGLLNHGKSTFELNDCFNKYRISEHHSIDINLDGKFDEADVTEADSFTFNIGVLTSGGSFSCGNLLPSVLKGLGYKIMGEKSGGGSCAISIETTADGIPFVRSTYLCLSDAEGNNIDSGVPVDFEIPADTSGSIPIFKDFFNFELVSNYLSTAYNS